MHRQDYKLSVAAEIVVATQGLFVGGLGHFEVVGYAGDGPERRALGVGGQVGFWPVTEKRASGDGFVHAAKARQANWVGDD